MRRRNRADRLREKHQAESRPTIATDGGADAIERGGAIDADGSGSGAAKASRRGVLKAGAAAAGLAGGVAGAAQRAQAGVINNLAGVKGPVAPGNGVGRLLPSNGTYLGDTFNLAGGQYTLAVGLTANGQATIKLGTGISYTDTTTGVQPGGINWLSGVSELGGGLFDQPVTQIGGSVTKTAGSKVLSARFVEQKGNMVVKARGVNNTTSPPTTTTGTTVTGPSGTFQASKTLSGQHRSYTATLSVNSGTWESMKIYDGGGNTIAGPGTGSSGFSVRYENTNIDSFASSPSVSFYAHAKTVDAQANIGGSLYGSPVTAYTFFNSTQTTALNTTVTVQAGVTKEFKSQTVVSVRATSGTFTNVNLLQDGGVLSNTGTLASGNTLSVTDTLGGSTRNFTVYAVPTAVGTGTTFDLGTTTDKTTNTGNRFGSLGKLTLTNSFSTYSLTAQVYGGTVTSAKIQTYQQGSRLASTATLSPGQSLTFTKSNTNKTSETWRAVGTATNIKTGLDAYNTAAATTFIGTSGTSQTKFSASNVTGVAVYAHNNQSISTSKNFYATLVDANNNTTSVVIVNSVSASSGTETDLYTGVVTGTAQTGSMTLIAKNRALRSATVKAYALSGGSPIATLKLSGSAQTPGKAGLSLYGSAYTV
jgi:hypothetical protein